MKNLILIFAMMTFTQSVFANVSVETTKLVLAAKLVDFQVNQQWLGDIDEGSIVMDLTDETMELTLQSQYPCPAGMVCAAVMKEYHQIKLNIVSINETKCGDTYIAEVDNTPADGLKETIKVVDYSKALCKIGYSHPTLVQYETFNPWTQETLTSYFGGETLFVQPIFFK